MAKTVQHVAFNCRDKAAQEKFYARHFGFERARVFNADEPGEFVMLKLGDVRMELFQSQAGPDASGGPQPVGFKHLCFEVEDVDAKRRELLEAGVDIDRVIDCGDQVPGLKVCFFRDPEGNVVELMTGWRDEENPPQRD
ncbi:MAG: VOC family protein [Planctomycetota bacterium]